MKERFKPNTDERPFMIVAGILFFYALVAGFVVYLYMLNRLNLFVSFGIIFVFTVIYFPRFLIIHKLNKKDKIEILDDCIMINGVGIYFSDIKAFQVQEKKPQVVFFMNNSMVVFNEARFYLKLQTEEVSFIAIGGEKIKLLKEFFQQIMV